MKIASVAKDKAQPLTSTIGISLLAERLTERLTEQ